MIYQADGYSITIKQKKVHEVGEKPEVFRLFLNNTLRGIMSRQGFVEIGASGRYFDIKVSTPIDNLKMYKGFSSSFVECQKGVYLRV